MKSSGHLTQSFRHAFRGLILVFHTEQSFRLQVIAACFVVIAGLGLHVSPLDWMVLLMSIGAVLVLELLNSVVERVSDAFKPRLHPAVRDIKDIMAAVVLLASMFAAVAGIVIFLPRLLTALSSLLCAGFGACGIL